MRIDGDTWRSATARCRSSTARMRNADGPIPYHWGLVELPRSGVARRSEEPSVSELFVLRSAQRRERRSVNARTPKVDPAVFRDKIVFVGVTAAGSVRRLRNAVFAAAGCPASRFTPRWRTTSCRTVFSCAAATAARVVVGGRARAGGGSRRDARCRRGGRRRLSPGISGLFGVGRDATIRRRLLAESVAADAGFVGGALWRRRATSISSKAARSGR